MTWNRLVATLSICGVVAGIVLGANLSKTPASTTAAASKPAAARFDRFPPGKTVTVQLPSGAAEELAADVDEQLRDWLLYGTIFDSGIDAAGLQQTLFDVPPVRSDYLRPVGGYAYGPMRWRRLPDSRVVVLTSGSAEEQKGQLGRAADEALCDSDTAPESFLVFSYELSPDGGTARLTRQPDVPAARLFSDHYGYRSATLRSAAALRGFLASVNRLTAVKVEDGQVLVSGRMDPARPARLMTAEDVAALWKSQKHVDDVTARRESIRQRVEQFESEWTNQTYSTEEEKEELTRRYETESAEIERLLESAPQGATASGFSLDPAQDFDKLRELFASLEPTLRQITEKPDAAISRAEIDSVATALDEKNAVPFLEIVDKISHSNDPMAAFVGLLADAATRGTQRQSARYDGLLQGTEVGMTLFYTDLLAKLWALDYLDSTPTDDVANFISLLKTPVNGAYLPELESLPGTRVWFGPDDDGFQKSESGVQFAARTTRIYAASSNPVRPGEESQPNAPSARFLGWWHDHYEDVARFEPQYQRLDEIMKWSVALGYLSTVQALDSLAYLGDENVTTSNWFPCWARQHRELRFSRWEEIEFFDERCRAGDRDHETETMPILTSALYRGSQVSGGVSLGSRQSILERPAISTRVPEALRRSGIDFATSEGNVLRTLSKTEYSLGSPSGHLATTTIKAAPEARFRALTAEFRPTAVETRLERQGNILRAATRIGDAEVATVSFVRRGDQLSVTVSRRDAARAHELLADLNAREAPENLAAWTSKRPDIATTVPIDAETALVRLNGADRWMKIAREAEPTVEIPANAALRAGKIGGGKERSWTAAFVDEATVAKALDKGEYLAVRAPESPVAGVLIEPVERGPPGGGTAVESGGIRAIRAGNATYVRRVELSSGDADPVVLRRLAREVDIDRALAFAEHGRYEEFAAEVARNPELYRRELARLKGELERTIEQELLAGNAQNALQLTTRLAQYGGDPARHTVKRAIAAAMAEKPQAAARMLNGMDVTPQVREQAVTTINSLLGRETVSPESKASLLRLAAFLDMMQFSGRNGLKVKAVGRNGLVDFEAELLNLQVRAVEGTSVPAYDVYVGADLPRGAVQYQPATRPGVDQLAFDPNLVEAFKVESRALALAEPSAIVDTRTGVRYRSAARMRLAEPATRYRSLSERCPPATEGQPPASGCEESIYILQPRTSGAAAAGS